MKFFSIRSIRKNNFLLRCTSRENNFLSRCTKTKLITCIIAALAVNITFVYAAEEIDLTRLTTKEFQHSINGGNIDFNNSINDEGEYEIHCSFNTENLETGYYTAFIFNTINEDWQGYDGFAFHLENMGQKVLNLNLNLQCGDKTELRINDGSNVLIKNDTSAIIEKVRISQGTFNIYEGFDGTVYIPFKSMNTLEGEENKSDFSSDLSNVYLWGMPVTCEENRQVNFKLSKFSLINAGQIGEKYLSDGLQIEGSSRMIIPTAGQSIAQFKAVNSDKAVFKILEDIDYADITEEGRLTVYDAMEPQNIRICAVDGNLSETKEIELFKSWTVGKTYDDGASMQILKANEIESLISNKNILMNRYFLVFLRLFIGLGCIVFLALFFYWKNIRKQKVRNSNE